MSSLGEGFSAVALMTAVTIALIALVLLRPSLVAARGGRILAFIAFLVLPVLVTATGLEVHMENSKTTAFCLSCHTTYTLFGDYRAKLTGLRHVYVNYIGTLPKTIQLYQPYNNRECLHCHAGGRKFEEDDVHKGARDDLAANKTSCLECHGTIHDVANVGHLPLWHGGKP
jgi:nitrate/TMAO reductase-like tetraheme cytochrome c subunit